MALCVGLWLFLRKSNEVSKHCIAAVSQRSSLILEVHQPQVSWSRLTKDTKYFASFSGIESFNTVLGFCRSADSVMKANHQFAAAFNNSPLILSITGSGSTDTEMLLTANFSDPSLSGEMSAFLNGTFPKSGQVKEIAFQEKMIYEVAVSIIIKPWYCSSSDGIFVLSTSLKAVQDALLQINSNKSILDDPSFAKAYKVAGKKTDANLFINYKSATQWAGKSLTDDSKEAFMGMSDFASWTGIDINLKPESISLSGFTWLENPEQYINNFKGKPIENALISKLPQNVSGFFYFGTESLKESGKGIYKTIHKSPAPDSLSQKFLGWMGKEMVLGIVDNHDTLVKENSLLLVSTLDSASSSEGLSKLFATAPPSGMKELNETYNGIPLRSMNNQGLFRKFFGSTIGLIENNYYAHFGSFVVFANNSLTLKNYINYYLSEKTLLNDGAFVKFSENLAAGSNMYVFSRPTPIGRKIRQYILPPYLSIISPYIDALKSFDGMALQFSSQTDGFYTGGFISFGETATDSTEVTTEGWTANLDTTATSAPIIIENPTSGEAEIIVQDDAHKLYCITTLGRIKWTVNLKEAIVGELRLLKEFSGKNAALVGSTHNAIHAIGLDGTEVSGYPVNLDAKTTSGLSVFDYDNKKEYRLVYACANEKCYNLDKHGKTVKGWGLNKLNEDVSHTIRHVQAGTKDFLFMIDDEGKVKIYDRQGKKKTETKEKFELSVNNTVYAHSGKNAKQTGLYFTIADGTIIYVGSDGKAEKINIKPFTENHHFIAEDLDGDGNVEFVFIDLNELHIFNRQKKEIGTYKWDEEIHFAPQIIKQNASKSFVGIVSGESQQVYLFGYDGQLAESFPQSGSTPFAVKFKEGKPELVITTDGKKVLKIWGGTESKVE